MPLKSCASDSPPFRSLTRELCFGILALVLGGVPSAVAQTPAEIDKYRSDQEIKVQDANANHKSLLTDEIRKDFAANERDYRQLINRGINNGNSRQLKALQAGLNHRVAELTDPEIQGNAAKLNGAISSLVRELRGAGRNIANGNEKKAFRERVFRETVPMLKECLKGNVTSRSLAINVLAELEVVPAVPGGNVRIEMSNEVHSILTGILSDPEQPDVIRFRAVDAMMRILEKADVLPQVQMEYASAMASELGRIEPYVEYQVYLATALGKVTAPRQVIGQQRAAIVIKALAEAVQDRRRDLLVRCQAAAELGRVGYDAQIKFEPLAWKTAQLAVEVGLSMSDPRKVPQSTRQLAGASLYFAFHHENAAGKNNPRNPQGFLNRAPQSQAVRDAYAVVLPIAKSLIFDKPVAGGDVLAADTWCKENQPDPLVYDPASPAIQP